MTAYPIYQIHIAGLLDHSWSVWFEELTITYTAENNTILSGSLPDQAALHGVLNKIRDLGLTLTSVSVLPAAADDDEGTWGLRKNRNES